MGALVERLLGRTNGKQQIIAAPVPTRPAQRKRGTRVLDTDTLFTTSRDGFSSLTLADLNQVLPRHSDFHVLDFIREAIPILDSAVSALGEIEGRFRVDCGEDKANQAIADAFIEGVPLHPVGQGYWQYLDMVRDDVIHYGYAVTEMIPLPSFGGIERLVIPDARTFRWERIDGQFRLVQFPERRDKRIVIEDYTWVSYWTHRRRHGHPEGVSRLWGLEFPVRAFIQLLNALQLNAERFAAPSFMGKYQSGVEAESPEDDRRIERRADQIKDRFKQALEAKKSKGQVVDAFFGFAKDEDFTFEILGEPGALLDVEQYVSVLTPQMLSKLHVTPWMLGLSDVEGFNSNRSTNELDLITSFAETRRHAEAANIRKDLDRMFLLAGRPNAQYEIVWEDITLRDETELARADLATAQAEMYRVSALEKAVGLVAAGYDPEAESALDVVLRRTEDEKARHALANRVAHLLLENGDGAGARYK